MRTTIEILLLAGLLVIAYLWHSQAATSRILEAQRDSLRAEIAAIDAERDSLFAAMRLRADSIETFKRRTDSLTNITTILRSELRRIERDVDELTRPDFNYDGSDSALAAVADSILRARLRAADRDSLR